MVSRIIRNQEIPLCEGWILTEAGVLAEGVGRGAGMCVWTTDSPGEINIPSLITHANTTLRELGRGLHLSSGPSHVTGDLCDLVLTGERREFRKQGPAHLSPASSLLQPKWCD